MKRPSARRSPTAGNRGNGGKWIRPALRRRIYERDRGVCVWCQHPVTSRALPDFDERRASLDHIVPRSRGGSNRPSNLITCCQECNACRGDRSVPEFARVIARSGLPRLEAILLGCERSMATVRRVRAAQRRKLPPDHAGEAAAQRAEVARYIEAHPDPGEREAAA